MADGHIYKLSIILPCRNEEMALENCLLEIKKVIFEQNINAEIIVSDSSTDDSPLIAKKHQVKLIKHDLVGYGNAYLNGFEAAQGEYIFMADADGSYDFNDIPKFIEQLDLGYDFVIGNRFGKTAIKGSMPFLHRYLGNPILSMLLRIIFKTGIRDAQSGVRAIKREALMSLNLRTTGMEFASEMILKALKNGLKIKELPVKYFPRQGKSKLKPVSDGWRHIRFILLYSPWYFFFFPGVVIFFLGLSFLINLSIHSNYNFSFHLLFFALFSLLAGFQLIFFGLFTKTYAITHLNEEEGFLEKTYRYFSFGKVSIIGIGLILLGLFSYLGIYLNIFGIKISQLNLSILSLTAIIIGLQTITLALVLSILGIREK